MLTERLIDRSLNLMPIAPDPICPACGSRIVSGSVVFYNDDHLTHIDCHKGILTDAAAKSVAVLARHPAADFCHTCLAGELNIDDLVGSIGQDALVAVDVREVIVVVEDHAARHDP